MVRYVAREDQGQLEVCAVVSDGVLNGEVSVDLDTTDGTAVGKCWK